MSKKIKTGEKTKKPKGWQSVRGMHDILPKDQYLWRKLRGVYEDISDFYGFKEITTPIIEPRGIFEKGMGETSDVVSKEMYEIKVGKGKERLVLRPEFTAGVVRAYIENGGKNWPHPVKLCSFGPCFRHERPQAGRLRQFWQVNYELFSSSNDPVFDAQLVLMSYRFLEKLKLKNVVIRINSIGSRDCRLEYIKKLKTYYKNHQKELTVEQKKKLESNPLRLLDSNDENLASLKEATPNILDCLDKESKKHFKDVLEHLDELEIPYVLDHTLVRGLDYYTNTVFELVLEEKADEGTEAFTLSLGGGGRYDPLIKLLGGADTPGAGFALGLDRIILALKSQNNLPNKRIKNSVFFVHIGDMAKKKSLKIIEGLRNENIHITEYLGKGSLSSQLKMADKEEAKLALIFGQKEAFEESIIVRDMKSGAQEIVPLSKVSKAIKKALK